MTLYQIKQTLRKILESFSPNNLRIGTGEFSITSSYEIIAKFETLFHDEYKGEIRLNKRQIKSLLTNAEFSTLTALLFKEIENY